MFFTATLATESQWEVADCTEENGYACKGPEGMGFLEILHNIIFYFYTWKREEIIVPCIMSELSENKG